MYQAIRHTSGQAMAQTLRLITRRLPSASAETAGLRVVPGPTRRLIVLLATGLITALLPVLIDDRLWPLWIAHCGLVAAAGLIDAALSPSGRQIRLELELPGAMLVGEDHEAVLTCSARYGRTRSAAARLDCSRELEAPETIPIELGHEPAQVHIPLRASRRGRVAIVGLWIRYSGPLGLWQRTLVDRTVRAMPVRPSITAVRSMALRFSLPAEHTIGLRIERFAGAGSEFHSMREYVPGMDSRFIDWKASARHATLLCREHRAERNHHIVFAIDTGRIMSEELSGLPRLDSAIHAALMLSFISLRSGDRISLFPFDAAPGRLSPPHRGIGSFQSLLDLSTQLRYTTAETNFTLGLTQLLTQLRRRALVVVLTDFVDSVTAELMVENLLQATRRHLVIFAAIRNPLFDELESAEPTTLGNVHRSVIAASLARDRELVIRRLSRAGVLCADVLPSALGPSLVNRYLEIKRREMI